MSCPLIAGEGGWISPGASESVIPLNIDKIVCKGRHVADPQVFLASSTSHDAEGSSTDDSVCAMLRNHFETPDALEDDVCLL